MNRKLFIIISDGGGVNALTGVHLDEQNYINFFKSPEGGAWKNDEILVFNNNNFSLQCLSEFLHVCRLNGTAIDYIMMVYCGHGFTDEYGNIQFQVQPQINLSLNEILVTVSDIRLLLIADSCRAVYNLHEGGRIRGVQQLFQPSDERQSEFYANICRQIYNELIMNTPQNMKTILFADSYGETAAENRNGGLYSYQLLSTAKNMIDEFNERHQHTNVRYYDGDIISCHNIASRKVSNLTNDTQHPEIYWRCRSVAQLPFVVCPNWHLQDLGE